jgi:hypothetical protein
MSDFLTLVTQAMGLLGLDTSDVRRGPLTDEADLGDETALVDYTGAPPEMSYCGPITRLPRVAVFARRATRLEAAARAMEIHEAFVGAASLDLGSGVFFDSFLGGEPAWFDEDANGRTIYTASYEVRRRG